MFVKKPVNTRLQFVAQKRSCSIMYKDKRVYRLFEEWDNFNDVRSYIFVPDWEVIDWFNANGGFPGMIGMDEDLHLDEYVRTNILPAFMDYRLPSSRRPELSHLLRRVGLDWYDKFEYMIRTGGMCSCDPYYVELLDDDIL